MLKLFHLLILIIIVIIFPSCDKQNRDENKELDELKGRVRDIEFEIKIQESITKKHFDDLIQLEYDFLLDGKRIKHLFIDLKNCNGFQTVYSSYGMFFVSVKDVQPYLDGYKITFEIGNPGNVTYTNPKITLKWGLDLNNENLDELNKIKEREFNILKDLERGYWNKIEIFVNPLKSNELGFLDFSIETPTIKLYVEK